VSPVLAAAESARPHRVPQLSAGDVAQIAEVFRAERGRLLAFAYLLVGDRAGAEDLVQEAFISLQRRWNSLTDPQAAVGFMRVCVINAARSHHRRGFLARRHVHVADLEGTEGADAAVLLAEEHREVAAVVRALPRRQQQVIVLRYWAQMSEAQIADVLGVSKGTVKASASRAVAAIGKKLGAKNER